MDKHSTGYKIFRENFIAFFSSEHTQMDILEFILGKMSALKTNLDAAQEVDDILQMFAYLGIVETVGNSMADIITILLVVNGIDFHIESAHGIPRVRHATSIKSLETEKVPLTAKLNFLKENGIPTLANLFNSKLRNDIAHSKFVIKDDKVYFKHRRGLKPAQVIVPAASADLFNGIVKAYELLLRLATEENWVEDKR